MADDGSGRSRRPEQERRQERREAREIRRAQRRESRRGQVAEAPLDEPLDPLELEELRELEELDTLPTEGGAGAARCDEQEAGGRRGRSGREPLLEESREDVIREARHLARAKARVARELVEFAAVVGVLSMVLPIAAWIVGVIWGLEIAGKFAKKVLEPSLRRRWIDREVHRRLRRTVPVERRQIEGEHSRRIEELAAGVAHEIRNPITAARSLVQQMGEDPGAKENVDYARIALDELQRVEKSVAHLLRFAREEEFHSHRVALDDVIESAVEALGDRAARAGARIETDLDDAETLLGDGEQLRRVMLNLLGNALDAVEEAAVSDPHIQIQAGENLAGTEVWVRIRDNGPGIDSQRLSRIFSPFYTSKEAGTGLGLAISKKVIDAHGGSIEAESDPGRGTQFLITLPKNGPPHTQGGHA